MIEWWASLLRRIFSFNAASNSEPRAKGLRKADPGVQMDRRRVKCGRVRQQDHNEIVYQLFHQQVTLQD